MSGDQMPVTEQAHPASSHLDTLTAEQAIDLMHAADDAVTAALAAVSRELATAAERLADTIRSGGRLMLLGSGTGGRLAIQEVSELPPTFGVREESVLALVSSGAPVGPAAITRSEDDVEAAPAALRQMDTGPGDMVIGLAASGRTPFVVAGIEAARRAGAWTVGIANNHQTPLLSAADLPIVLATGPEILTGSTRLKAGTAQKVALNRITTVGMVRAGRTSGNQMSHMRVTNDKLRARAVRIVTAASGVTDEQARDLLVSTQWQIPAALNAAHSLAARRTSADRQGTVGP